MPTNAPRRLGGPVTAPVAFVSTGSEIVLPILISVFVSLSLVSEHLFNCFSSSWSVPATLTHGAAARGTGTGLNRIVVLYPPSPFPLVRIPRKTSETSSLSARPLFGRKWGVGVVAQDVRQQVSQPLACFRSITTRMLQRARRRETKRASPVPPGEVGMGFCSPARKEFVSCAP